MKKGWVTDKLSNCIKLKSGDGLTAKNMVQGNYPVYGGNGIVGYHSKYNLSGENIIIGRVGALCGISRYIDKEIWLTDNAFKISEFKYSLDLEFLNYLLNFVDLRSYARQAAQPVISNSSLKDVVLSFPKSLPEQKRIVNILDKTFAEIAQAKANAEQNLKNAKELFESYLNGIFENKGDDWEVKTLGDVANVTYGYTAKSFEEGDYRYVRITDIDNNGELISSGKKYIKATKDGKEFILKDNDIVMARTGATFAKLLLYKNIEPSIFASYLIKIDFIEKIENELYWFFTKTDKYWEQANSLSTGAAQPHFNGKALKQVVFSYPKSIVKQKELIQEFRKLQAETKKLELVYQQKLDNLEELKKSILQKAFNGEL